MKEEKEQLLLNRKDDVLDNKLNKMRFAAEAKLKMIDEFKKTLENSKWNYEHDKMEEQKKQEIHDYFIEELKKEKVYKK